MNKITLGFISVFGWTKYFGSNNQDFALVKYNAAGEELAADIYDSHPNSRDWAVAMALDAAGNVYVTGYNEHLGSPGWQRNSVIKYTVTPVSILPGANNYSKEPLLYQNYPNPFNPVTQIRYSLPTAAHAILKVYDLLGREVEVLVNSRQPASEHRVSWDASAFASGVYIYRLQTGENTLAKKLLLLK